MSRWKAAGTHACISLFVALVTFGLIFCLWYPPPYFQATAADRLILLLVGVDLCLGPLLTLVVFRSGKKWLRFDLAMIGLVQAAALVYGMSVILESRPVFLVSAVDRFVVVAADEISDEDLSAAPPAFRHRSWTGPVLVGSQRPGSASERTDLLFSGLAGKDIEQFPKYYVPYTQAAPELLTRAHTVDDLRKLHPGALNRIADWLQSHQRQDEDVAWVPLVARDDDLVMFLDGEDGAPLGTIALDPWQSIP